jgi:hypothetical protein
MSPYGFVDKLVGRNAGRKTNEEKFEAQLKAIINRSNHAATIRRSI